MIDDKRVLAVVPARGSSKRFPGKNLKPIGGRPMIAWTINAAKESRHVDRAILSTDDEEIRRVAAEHGLNAPFERPPELATDGATSTDVLTHALDNIDDTFDIAVLLQPTSPLRTADDIDGALKAMSGRNATSCLTVSRALKSPYWMFSVNDEDRMQRLLGDDTPEPDPPDAYIPNGAFFGVSVPWFLEHRTFYDSDTIAHRMPEERSVDIDTEMDFLLAEALLGTGGDET